MARPKATSGKKQVRKLAKTGGTSYTLALSVEKAFSLTLEVME